MTPTRSRYTPLWMLIAANAAVFVAVTILWHTSGFMFLHRLALPLDVAGVMHAPWTALTYMFLQVDMVHLGCNMLMLWAFGYLLVTLSTRLSVVWAYLGGGLLTAAAYVAAGSIVPGTEYLYGASGAVLGVAAACAVQSPRHTVSLALLGRVRVIWIVTLAVILLAVAPYLDNPVSLAVHLAGAAGGAATQYIIKKRNRRNREWLLEKAARVGFPHLSDKEKRQLCGINRHNA